MIVPIANFQHMPERMQCGNSLETGSPVAAGDGKGRYVRSLVNLIDAQRNVIGWIYLADDYHGNAAEYIQGNAAIPYATLYELGLGKSGAPAMTTIALLRAPLRAGLGVAPCVAHPTRA